MFNRYSPKSLRRRAARSIKRSKRRQDIAKKQIAKINEKMRRKAMKDRVAFDIDALSYQIMCSMQRGDSECVYMFWESKNNPHSQLVLRTYKKAWNNVEVVYEEPTNADSRAVTITIRWGKA